MQEMRQKGYSAGTEWIPSNPRNVECVRYVLMSELLGEDCQPSQRGDDLICRHCWPLFIDKVTKIDAEVAGHLDEERYSWALGWSSAVAGE